MSILFVSALLLSSFRGHENGYTAFADGARIAHFYPNPATSYINFTFDKSVDRNYTLQVYNFMGRKMTESRVTDPSKLTINLNDNYLRGLYIYQLRDASGRIVESGKFQVSK